VALSFIGSAEFANRYGATPSPAKKKAAPEDAAKFREETSAA